MNYYIPQITETDCGFACLKMLIATRYESQDALFIKQDENKGVYSFQDLKELGSEYGIELFGVSVENKNNIRSLKFPFIALIKKKNGAAHYVFVKKIKLGDIYYSDPDEGDCFTSVKKFIGIWTGKALIEENFSKKEVEMVDVLKARKTLDIFSIILQIVSASFLLLGIYFINYTKAYIPMVFLSLFVVSEIIFRFYLINQMEKLDDDILENVKVDDEQYPLFLERYESYKKELMANKMNVVFSIIVIVSTSIMLLFNHFANTLLIVVPLFLAIIDVMVFNPFVKDKQNEISRDEKDLSRENNDIEFGLVMNRIHAKSYRLTRYMLIKKYLFIFLILVTSFVTMIYTEILVLPYLAFNALVSWTMYEQFNNLFNYPNRNISLLRRKVQVSNIVSKK